MATDVRDLGNRSTGPRPVALPLPPQGPLPSGQLLRPGGSVDPVLRPAAAEAWTQLSADAHRILVAVAGDWPSPRWLVPSFARQVQAVRRQLAPIEDPGLLAASFGREAFHGPRLGRVPAVWASPVRVAYAVRWIELQSGLAMPPWLVWVA
ncbi:MAG TPA: hypothetical protein VFY23_14865 [Candidatus Limnocylindrales bacterium]|nr:hypothetical protein [Candidatus Limnocylindrales bacterium]